MGQLESRELVARSVDPADRRSRTVALTSAGVRVRAEVIQATLAATPLAALDPAQLLEVAVLLAPAVQQPLDPDGRAPAAENAAAGA